MTLKFVSSGIAFLVEKRIVVLLVFAVRMVFLQTAVYSDLKKTSQSFSTYHQNARILNESSLGWAQIFFTHLKFSVGNVIEGVHYSFGKNLRTIDQPIITTDFEIREQKPKSEMDSSKIFKHKPDKVSFVVNFSSNVIQEQYNISIHGDENQTYQANHLPSKPPNSWGGIVISDIERSLIKDIRVKISIVLGDPMIASSSTSKFNNEVDIKIRTKSQNSVTEDVWLRRCTDIEILRFLRSNQGKLEDTWKSILKHNEWRQSSFGADTISSRNYNNNDNSNNDSSMSNQFENSMLNQEIFWLGIDSNDCPTLVIRTQAHDGKYYDEDPKIFTKFLVWILEKGVREFEVGTKRQVCLVLDRYPVYGLPAKEEKFDVAVIGRLVELFRMVYDTVLENYPELLNSAKIVPVSWFSRMCSGVTLRFMDSKNRDKFHMVNAKDVSRTMRSLFPAESLPPHLGGTAASYGSDVTNPSVSSTSREGASISSGSASLESIFKKILPIAPVHEASTEAVLSGATRASVLVVGRGTGIKSKKKGDRKGVLEIRQILDDVSISQLSPASPSLKSSRGNTVTISTSDRSRAAAAVASTRRKALISGRHHSLRGEAVLDAEVILRGGSSTHCTHESTMYSCYLDNWTGITTATASALSKNRAFKALSPPNNCNFCSRSAVHGNMRGNSTLRNSTNYKTIGTNKTSYSDKLNDLERDFVDGIEDYAHQIETFAESLLLQSKAMQYGKKG